MTVLIGYADKENKEYIVEESEWLVISRSNSIQFLRTIYNRPFNCIANDKFVVQFRLIYEIGHG